MDIDYGKIGQRIAARRRKIGLKQAQLSELADISNTYMSSIERAVSIPSIEVIMRLALALDTTPDEFLVGTASASSETHWQTAAQYLKGMTEKQLTIAESFLAWLSQQK